MSIGRAKYTVMLTEEGTILDDLIVYRLGETAILMVPNAGNAQAVSDAVVARTEGMEVTIVDATADLSLVGIQGPKAADVVAALGEDFAAAALVDKLSGYRNPGQWQ